MSEIHVSGGGFLLLGGVLSGALDLLELALAMLRGLLELQVDLLLELLRRGLAHVSLLFGDLVDLGNVLAELVAAFLSSLAPLLSRLGDVLLALLAEQQTRLVDGLLALQSGLAAFLLRPRRDGPAPHHKDIPPFLFGPLELLSDVRLADLRRAHLRVSLETLLDLWGRLIGRGVHGWGS